MMKIAVTYENGEVFQHFGHTETFKVYEVEDGRRCVPTIVEPSTTAHSLTLLMIGENRWSSSAGRA